MGGMSESLVVNEIYISLQGESTWAGLPCIFVRLTACNLRCSYCDTAYAFTEGKRIELAVILERIEALAAPYREVGGDQKLPLVEFSLKLLFAASVNAVAPPSNWMLPEPLSRARL